MKKIVLAIAIGAVLASSLSVTQAHAAPGQVNASIVVMAHPDDEMEVWSLIQNSPANYSVYAFMTQGEKTSYCVPAAYRAALAYSAVKQAPSPLPTAPGTQSCKDARINSSIRFINSMGGIDSSVPSDLTSAASVQLAGQSVRRYTSSKGMALFFNNGDGNLTTQEVINSVAAILASRNAIGIPTGLKVTNLIGNYYNSYAGCYVYTHADHRSVHSALWGHNFQTLGTQYGSTCRTDPDASRTGQVTNAPNVHHRITMWYGWLNSTLFPWDYSGVTQSGIFNNRQDFWKRY